MEQILYSGKDSFKEMSTIINLKKINRLFLVCGNSFDRLGIKDYLYHLGVEIIRFSNFTPNPDYIDIRKAIDYFNSNNCDALLAIGGGSAIDVAKCVKNYHKCNNNEFWKEESINAELPFIAIPTTSGSGSEATRFAVFYINGEKQSVNNNSIIPNFVILDCKLLYTLPDYQKKCTLMDALCQSIESYWSVNSTDESKKWASKAIEQICENWKNYIFNPNDKVLERIMLASYYAGKAINISQTTAAHAMSYKLTSLYGLPHGHAVVLSLPKIWEYMSNNLDKCCDKRGSAYLEQTFNEICLLMNCKNTTQAIDFFYNVIKILGLSKPNSEDRKKDLEILTKSVNKSRLKNNPVYLDESILYDIYERILQ